MLQTPTEGSPPSRGKSAGAASVTETDPASATFDEALRVSGGTR